MAIWSITFNKDGNTVKMVTESVAKPTVEEASQKVLELARREGFEPQDREGGSAGNGAKEPAVQLFERYGITLSGILKTG
ncbi:hypothetical protein [Azotobacter salinestris]|uniref:hypothetical protein n=1 Tax=Azotobacter salinestris TaxID=69964 RepID=UPI001266C3B5|nr:hypothetical protein [Azotobacter salinestris]